MVLWHQLDASAALAQLASDADRGLSEVESRRRLGEYGANELEADSRVSPVILLLEQFKNILVVILLVAVALSAFLGYTLEASAIAVICTSTSPPTACRPWHWPLTLRKAI